jgi:hypothetical protein
VSPKVPKKDAAPSKTATLGSLAARWSPLTHGQACALLWPSLTRLRT